MNRRRFISGLSAAAVAGAACKHDGSSEYPEPSERGSGTPPVAADLIVRGGTILTLDEQTPRVEAVAIADGRIVATGSQRELAVWEGPKTDVVDLQGGLATPGLTDAHAHLVGLGKALEEVDLRGATSIAEVIERLRAGDKGQAWLTGRGWDQNLWDGAAMPTHTPLTEAFPGRALWLRRVDGHAGWASRAALEASGIGKDASAPAGGEILRAQDGAPSGVLIDAAMGLMKLPEESEDDLRRWIGGGQAHALARGLTGVHDMGVGPTVDRLYRALVDAPGGLTLRVTGYADQSWFDAALTERAPDVAQESSRYALVGVKLYADGALGSRGAALLQPYADRADHLGLMQHEPAELLRLATAAMAGGWQAATHAIGDAANRAVLDAYAGAIAAHATADTAKDHRFRIEHCQIVAPADIARFAALGVIASMQPTHATSDMAWVPARIGEARLAGAYAWRRFLQAGVPLCFGSDFPVERTDVTLGLHAAVTRTDADGNPRGGWLPDQCVTLPEALAAFSATAAYAARREQHLGSVRPGMQADLTCFAEDLMAIDPRAIRDATVAATIVGGAVAFAR